MSAKHTLTRRQLMYGAAGGLAVLGAGSLRIATARAAARGGRLVIATPADSEPASLDGQVDPYTSTFLFDSFASDPLVVLTSDRKFVPGIASGWTAAAEGREWTFTIKDGIVFQDGTRCDAEAVRFNVERVMSPDTHSALMATDLGQPVFLQAEVVGGNQVRLLYREPFPELLSGMSIFPIWSPAAVKQYGTSFQQHLVGEGAFRLTSWVRGDHITFTRNPAYRGGTTVQRHSGPAYLDSITVKFVGSAGVLGEILKTGEANLVMGLPSQALPDYAHNAGYQVVTGYQPGNGMMFTMNTARAPLNDVRVRQAVRYAYDQHRMNQTLYNGTYVECYGPLTKYTLYYWKGADTAYRYDPARARTLLDAAGWKPGASGVRERDGKPLSLTMVMLHHREIGEYLAAQFRTVGVDLRPVVVPGPVQLQRALSGDFDLIYERLRTLEPDILYSEFYSKNEGKPGGWAWSGFHNARLDAALLRTQQTADSQVRARNFAEAQRLLTEFAVYLPTLDDPQFFAMPASVKGFQLGATGAWFFANDMYIE
jgi:peptide/nickel transport system substrate-binding protein